MGEALRSGAGSRLGALSPCIARATTPLLLPVVRPVPIARRNEIAARHWTSP